MERLILEADKVYVIGRDQGADVCLPEKKVSRKHALLVWSGQNDSIVLEDLGSLNGTFVNSEAVTGKIALANGDRIQVGSFLLQLQITENSVSEKLSKSSTDRKPKHAPLVEEVDAGPIGGYLSQIEQIPFDQTGGTGGRMLQGKLSEIPLADLLQMLSTTKKTGLLVVSKKKINDRPIVNQENPDTAFLVMRNGDVDFAAFDGVQGEDAFYAILGFNQGFFSLFSLGEDDSSPVIITTPIEALLIEGFRRMDEAKAHKTKISPSDVLDVRPDEPLGTLSADELTIFQSIWKHKKFAAVLDNSPFTEAQTTEIVKKLLRGGFVVKN